MILVAHLHILLGPFKNKETGFLKRTSAGLFRSLERRDQLDMLSSSSGSV